jgi:hypothetical protein
MTLRIDWIKFDPEDTSTYPPSLEKTYWTVQQLDLPAGAKNYPVVATSRFQLLAPYGEGKYGFGLLAKINAINYKVTHWAPYETPELPPEEPPNV